MKDIKILAVESSCDETAVAVVENGNKILSSVVATQIDVHKDFGGVIPEVARGTFLSAIFITLPSIAQLCLFVNISFFLTFI